MGGRGGTIMALLAWKWGREYVIAGELNSFRMFR